MQPEQSEQSERSLGPNISHSEYVADGFVAPIDIYTLTSSDRLSRVVLSSLGAAISHFIVSDRDGKERDVVLGFDNPNDYLSSVFYYGASIGRVCNRIAKGRFDLGGHTYQLAINNGVNHLHGGLVGFDKQNWKSCVISQSPPTIEFTLVSPGGQEGYPGTLQTSIVFTLEDAGALAMTFAASLDGSKSDQTIVNLTNHAYFNLSGLTRPNVLDHVVRLESSEFLELDETQIPTGRKLPTVDPSCMNFAGAGKTLGQDIGDAYLATTRGYDHFFLVPKQQGQPTVREVATAHCPSTGLTLQVLSDAPGFQLYTGNWLQNVRGKADQQHAVTGPYAGFCIEASQPPNAVNMPEYRPAVVLEGSQRWGQKTVYIVRAS
ncbi:aldose 1-epimerase [Polychytrium aggregatum]|uniref:aldose 1-epimerase n=1 Tax=Polychytrium aggregatum TaxID=110093 RepID=UPI0022FEDFEE|nr:aldose 1-epimerase [Polychytrium aggregatum]KAI9205341.1 aldose 1-epimerase [Polychytrium aggregatum]